MAQSLSQLYVHIVFHINLNNPVKIPEPLQPDLYAYLATICKNHESPSILVGGTSDHVHILCRLSKNIAASKLLEELKTDSSKWIKSRAEEFSGRLNRFSWQKGYGIFSVSASQAATVKEYIAKQKEHHKKISFKGEYLLLLKKYNIEYDENYLWN
ncbi:MAG: IS200/IS605 family transposase [Victivallales bacterium]